MPAPIYIPRRQNPWTNMMPGLLQSLVVQKIGQNMRLKEKEMDIKRITAEKAKAVEYAAAESGRGVQRTDAEKPKEGWVQNPYDPTSYIEPTGGIELVPFEGMPGMFGKVQNGRVVGIIKGHKPAEGPYKEGALKEFKEGNQIIMKEFRGGQWVNTDSVAPRYKPPSTNVNITNDMSADIMTNLGKKQGEALLTEFDNAKGAMSSLEHLTEAEKLIDSGMITGVGAKFITGLGNLLYSRLGYKKSLDPVKNTEAFKATMGTQVGQIIKQFGSGTGLSDADREYAERIVGGDISMTEESIRELMRINKIAHRNVIRNYNKKAEQVMKKKGSENLLFDLRIEGVDDVFIQGDVVNGYKFKGGDPKVKENWIPFKWNPNYVPYQKRKGGTV
jgi:hypothetical protein